MPKKICIVIPTRFDSSRFHGKVFANILGKPLIKRVWDQCIKAVNKEDVYILTPDKIIKEYCEKNNMKFIMTSIDCQTGTDRIAEALDFLKNNYKMIINVQGDEPLIDPEDILKVLKSVTDLNFVYCGMSKIDKEEEFSNPNIIKIITDVNNNLLYASRAPIPFSKNNTLHEGYKQVCIYIYSKSNLSIFKKLKRGPNEKIEDIEILRFIENSIKVKMIEVSNSSVSVDIPEDIIKVENILRKRM